MVRPRSPRCSNPGPYFQGSRNTLLYYSPPFVPTSWPPLPVKIRECNWDYNQVGSIGSVTLLKRVIATFQKWKAKSKYNLVDVMLQCHVSNDAHRLNCHEKSGKRFHGLVTVY